MNRGLKTVIVTLVPVITGNLNSMLLYMTDIIEIFDYTNKCIIKIINFSLNVEMSVKFMEYFGYDIAD